MAKTRKENERDINYLYGCPGADHSSDTGRELLEEMLLRHGLTAFSDDFIAELAARHLQEDIHSVVRSEAAERRAARGY